MDMSLDELIMSKWSSSRGGRRGGKIQGFSGSERGGASNFQSNGTVGGAVGGGGGPMRRGRSMARHTNGLTPYSKDQLENDAPVNSGIAIDLLQKMECKTGEGHDKTPSGSSEPLLLDNKRDERGIVTEEEFHRNITKKFSKKGASLNSSVEGKNQISFLNELCAKRKWGVPKYDVLDESGPRHIKTFIMTVNVNGQQYTSSRCQSKKLAKLEAAKECLKAIVKNSSGSSEPLLLDDKRDERGIVTEEEFHRNITKKFSKKGASLNSSVEGKNQISFLNELCAKKKWGVPEYDVLDESRPRHRKTFIMTVNVNGQQYTSSRCQSKKLAKLEAAKACLKAIEVLK